MHAIRMALAASVLGGGSTDVFAQAPAPPQAGFSLSLTLGPGWNSNPLELPGRRKGDGYFGFETVAAYRWNLWDGGALTLASAGYSELYFREDSAGLNRIAASTTLSQRWQDITFTLGMSARSAVNQALTAHDSASQDISIGVSRSFTLAKDLSLSLSSGASRRFYQDGAEDQLRARLGATLAQKWDLWTFRIGTGFSYALEDKTPLLPRINDRSISANIGATYDWAKDREVSVKLTYSRTYSSLQLNRFKVFGLSPQVGATLRF
jgi:hypothetical protein